MVVRGWRSYGFSTYGTTCDMVIILHVLFLIFICQVDGSDLPMVRVNALYFSDSDIKPSKVSKTMKICFYKFPLDYYYH